MNVALDYHVKVEPASGPDLDFLGDYFEDKQVLLAKRSNQIKAAAAWQMLPEAFYVSSFWAEGANELTYDAACISTLCLTLRRMATQAGYAGVTLHMLLEDRADMNFAPLMAYMQLNCHAHPTSIFAFMPAIRVRDGYVKVAERGKN